MTLVVIASAAVAGLGMMLALQVPVELRLLPSEAAWGQLGWPWPVTDAWSFAGNLGQALLVGFAFAWLLRVGVRRASRNADLRLWPAAAAMALVLASRPLEGDGLALLALLVVVAKAVALKPRATERAPHRPAVTAAIAVGAGVLLIASFAYQPTHPLIVAFAARQNPLSQYQLDPLKPPDRRLGFTVTNEGLGDATVTSIRATGAPSAPMDVAKTAELDAVVTGGRPLAGTTLLHGQTLHGKLVLPRAACEQLPLVDAVPAVVVYGLEMRVETLGMVRTQRFDVVPPARLFCH